MTAALINDWVCFNPISERVVVSPINFHLAVFCREKICKKISIGSQLKEFLLREINVTTRKRIGHMQMQART